MCEIGPFPPIRYTKFKGINFYPESINIILRFGVQIYTNVITSSFVLIISTQLF